MPAEFSNSDSSEQIPTFDKLLWPTLCALTSLGGSASISELDEQVALEMELLDDALDRVHGNGPQSEFAYRSGWARTYLKKMGAITNTEKGVWAILEIGRLIASEKEVAGKLADVRKQIASDRKDKLRKQAEEDELEEESTHDWKDLLLSKLRTIDPSAFERLCQRILRDNGFISVEVSGRSGDGGIDGSGVLRIKLISFHVHFQCKRYSGSVQASQVRDFRGAMVGRADKGLFITTGHFTRSAIRESVRDGAPPIDLIDGLQLCDLLKDSELGVHTEPREQVTLRPEFFDSL